MAIHVELFGIPRERAGVGAAEVAGRTLGDVLTALAARFPRLAGECICDARLVDGYTANVNGQRFVVDPATPLADGDAVLLLSADAGG